MNKRQKKKALKKESASIIKKKDIRKYVDRWRSGTDFISYLKKHNSLPKSLPCVSSFKVPLLVPGSEEMLK